MDGRQIFYLILHVIIFLIVSTRARSFVEVKMPDSYREKDDTNDETRQMEDNLLTKRSLDSLLSQDDLNLFEDLTKPMTDQSGVKTYQDQDNSVLLADIQHLIAPFDDDEALLLQFSRRMMARSSDGESALMINDTCEMYIVEEELSPEEAEMLTQEEYYDEEAGESVIAEIAVSEASTCQDILQCEHTYHPFLGARCFCRNVLVCESAYS